MSELSSGGPTATLPEGWTEPWGYPAVMAMVWVGEEPATEEDIDALRACNPKYDVDKLSLCGVLNRDWNTLYYLDKWGPREQLLESGMLGEAWERLSCEGGLGSWAYQSQNLLDGMDGCMEPKKWLWESSAVLKKSEGGEPYHLVPVEGAAGHDYYLGGAPGTDAEGITVIEWDADSQWFKTI